MSSTHGANIVCPVPGIAVGLFDWIVRYDIRETTLSQIAEYKAMALALGMQYARYLTNCVVSQTVRECEVDLLDSVVDLTNIELDRLST